MPPKAKTILYWICTGLVCLSFLAGGVQQLMRSQQVVEGLHHLGYPDHFNYVLGFWKVAGALTLLVPRFPLVKEWAYAGMFFDLSAAPIAHASVGDPIGHIIVPIIMLGILAASWALRPESRRLGRS